ENRAEYPVAFPSYLPRFASADSCLVQLWRLCRPVAITNDDGKQIAQIMRHQMLHSFSRQSSLSEGITSKSHRFFRDFLVSLAKSRDAGDAALSLQSGL